MTGRISRSTLIFLIIVLAAVGIMAALVMRDRADRLEYTLTFSDAQGITAGAPARLNGADIGQVTNVRLVTPAPKSPEITPTPHVEVTIRVFREYRNAIHEPPNSTGRIHKGTPLIGEPYIEILNRGDLGAGMPGGATVEGLDGWSEELTWTGRGGLAKKWDKALTAGRGQVDQLQLWLESKDAQQAKESVLDFMEDFQAAIERQNEQAHDKAIELAGEAKVKAADLAGRARQLGAELKNSPKTKEAAKKLDESLQKLLAENERLSEESRRKLEEVLQGLRSSDVASTATMNSGS